MTAKLYSNRLVADSITATEEAADHAASLIGRSPVGRDWRSTTTGAVTIVIGVP